MRGNRARPTTGLLIIVLISVTLVGCRANADQRSLEATGVDVLSKAGYGVIDVAVNWPEDGVTTVALRGDSDPSSAAAVLRAELSELPESTTLRIWVGRAMSEHPGAAR